MTYHKELAFRRIQCCQNKSVKVHSIENIEKKRKKQMFYYLLFVFERHANKQWFTTSSEFDPAA